MPASWVDQRRLASKVFRKPLLPHPLIYFAVSRCPAGGSLPEGMSVYTNEARDEPDLATTPKGMSAVHGNPLLAAAEPEQAHEPDLAAPQRSPAGMSVYRNPIHEGMSPGALSFGSPVHGGEEEEPASPLSLPPRSSAGSAAGAELWHDAPDATTPSSESAGPEICLT